MLFDTDVLIWFLRGNENAVRLLNETDDPQLSIVTFMELQQGARDKQESRTIKSFLAEFGFQAIPLTENIGHRASIYMEEYGLKAGICVADALLAATAVENKLPLCTANRKHYGQISEIDLRIFRP